MSPLSVRAAAVLPVAITLAAAGFVAACGGDEPRTPEELGERLARIDRRGGELWGRLAERAEDLAVGRRFPADVERSMTALVRFQRRAAGELEALEAPTNAADDVDALVEALRARTAAFEQTIRSGRITRRAADRITEAGHAIDAAFRRLGAEGFVSDAEQHPG